MKAGWKHYFEPTPKRIRVIGDSIVAAATFAASISVLNGHAIAGTVIMIVGAAGKFVSNFFSE